MRCLAITGGVGGAKLALGLAKVLSPAELTIVGNTGDDFDHLGLRICPDLDTVMYTLADLANKELGWGQAGETWHFLEALERVGGEAWFRLGDRDMATHIQRSELLRQGQSLSDVTAALCQRLGVEHPIVPMTDDSVATRVHVKSGEVLAFQHYFVRDRCEPEVTSFEFAGMNRARPSEGFLGALEEALSCILICPSNPFVSVDPVLKLADVESACRTNPAPVIAVSPIVGGEAIKGPAAKMMAELGMPQSALAVAEHYVGRIDGFVVDTVDAHYVPEIEALGMRCLVTKTFMKSLEDRIQLAEDCLQFAATF